DGQPIRFVGLSVKCPLGILFFVSTKNTLKRNNSTLPNRKHKE
ncbi:MAG: hypothetical protein ACI8YQ_005006, partial [Polaribacter sp.]